MRVLSKVVWLLPIVAAFVLLTEVGAAQAMPTVCTLLDDGTLVCDDPPCDSDFPSICIE